MRPNEPLGSSTRMRRADRWYLLGLCTFAVVAFHPAWREPQFANISLFGWLMAALMVLSPMAALALFLRERRGSRRGHEVGSQ